MMYLVVPKETRTSSESTVPLQLYAHSAVFQLFRASGTEMPNASTGIV